MTDFIKNNVVEMVGEVVSNPEYSHTVYGEAFYKMPIRIKRTSDYEDIIPCCVSEREFDVHADVKDCVVYVQGQLRSFNKKEDEKTKLILSIFARKIEFVDANTPDKNEIEIVGTLCKKPVYRKTPLGREITDLLVAVNRPYGKSDYLPCIAWGRNARFTSEVEVGTKFLIKGRVQSRQYTKVLPDGTSEERSAYEVSVSRLEVLAEDTE